tara:strand:+ start:1553 stop:1744 length:192 start_codon:yes stop_codon:yes gene_type:complete
MPSSVSDNGCPLLHDAGESIVLGGELAVVRTCGAVHDVVQRRRGENLLKHARLPRVKKSFFYS